MSLVHGFFEGCHAAGLSHSEGLALLKRAAEVDPLFKDLATEQAATKPISPEAMAIAEQKRVEQKLKTHPHN